MALLGFTSFIRFASSQNFETKYGESVLKQRIVTAFSHSEYLRLNSVIFSVMTLRKPTANIKLQSSLIAICTWGLPLDFSSRKRKFALERMWKKFVTTSTLRSLMIFVFFLLGERDLTSDSLFSAVKTLDDCVRLFTLKKHSPSHYPSSLSSQFPGHFLNFVQFLTFLRVVHQKTKPLQ